MSRGLNKATLIGNLGAEPEPRSTRSEDSQLVTARLATTESYKDHKTNQRKERTEWHNLVFFGRLGEIVLKHLHKGSQIYVEGRIQTRDYTNQAGDKRQAFEIVVKELRMLGSKPAGASGTQDDDIDPDDDLPY